MTEPEIPVVNIVAWVAVVFCIVATIHCAMHVRKHARLFTSLTFFALSWAILLPYYGLIAERELPPGLSEVFELLPAYNGLLLTLAGGPLRREAVIRAGHRDPGISKHDTWALYALYGMVLPHVIGMPKAPDILLKYHTQIVMVLGTGFTFLGFISILQGLRQLISKSIDRLLWWSLTAVTVVALVTEVGFTASLLPNPERAMSPYFKWAYAVIKLCLSGLFLVIVVRQAPRGSNRSERTVRKRAKRLKKHGQVRRRGHTAQETK